MDHILYIALFQVSLLLSWKMKVPSSRPQPEEHDGRLGRALHRNILGQETALASSDTEDDGIWRKRSRISISRHRYTTTLLKSDILESWQPEYDLPKTTCRSTQWQRSSWQSEGKKQTSSFTVLYWHQSLEDSFSCFFHQVYGPGKRTTGNFPKINPVKFAACEKGPVTYINPGAGLDSVLVHRILVNLQNERQSDRWVDFCSGPFPSWRHSLTKSSNKQGSGTSLHHPKGTCRPVWHHSNARRLHAWREGSVNRLSAQ